MLFVGIRFSFALQKLECKRNTFSDLRRTTHADSVNVKQRKLRKTHCDVAAFVMNRIILLALICLETVLDISTELR